MSSRFLFVLLMPLLTALQSSSEIKWSDRNLLTWKDFSKVKQTSETFKAMTHSGIRSNAGYVGDELSVEVICFFDPARSWVLEGHESDALLKHEQLHFDITELYARKLRKAYKNLGLNRWNYEEKKSFSIIDSTYNAIYDLMELEQERYDLATDHSKIELKQREWENKIKGELAALQSFSR